MAHWQKIQSEDFEGFEITYYVQPEDLDPRGQFEDDDLPDILEGINSGRYEWFVAKVTARKNGIELGADYLGGCLYSSFEEFAMERGYYEDMRAQAIAEARANISKLCEA